MTVSTLTTEERRAARVESCRRGGLARAHGADMKAVGAMGGLATLTQHGREHMAAVGSLGWAALVHKVGIAGAVERLHNWKVDHPSSLEITVREALGGLGLSESVDYERDAMVQDDPPIYGDFVFRSRCLVIEADGRRWHTNDPLHGQDRIGRDARRDRVLAAAGWTVVHVEESVVKDPQALLAALEWALTGERTL